MKQVCNCGSQLGVRLQKQEQELIPTTSLNPLQIRTVFFVTLTAVEWERKEDTGGNKLDNHATLPIKYLSNEHWLVLHYKKNGQRFITIVELVEGVVLSLSAMQPIQNNVQPLCDTCIFLKILQADAINFKCTVVLPPLSLSIDCH